MQEKTNGRCRRGAERGVTLFMVAAALLGLLGISALAIDLVTLYVARNEAQRAADAAALAGAKAFADSGFTSGLVPASVVQSLATARAINVGAQNKVGGQPAFITSSDISFDFSNLENPRITVMVQRIAARGTPGQPGGAMPTIFAKALGFLSADVSAMATAEAYNGSGGPTGPPVCAGCVKPVVLPNCDPGHTGPIPSAFCLGSAEFVNPACLTNPSFPGICNPGPISQGGVIGMEMVIRPGLPSGAPAPSQYYSLAIGAPGANQFRANIQTCNTSQFACGNILDLETGDMRGPLRQGFMNLIHQPGQDTIDTSLGPPFPITGGNNNPNPALRGQLITTSDSIVTIPLYDGHALCPGGGKPCGASVMIVGYLQMFIKQVSGNANVTAVILNVSGCGTLGGTCSPGSGSVSGGGASLIPIRLVRNPGT